MARVPRRGARPGVDDDTIRTVFTKLIGFSNFGFPKAHSAAFAVLAYQSAWLRQRYPAEFLAALMNAQPMGFYPPASLVRDAQRRGVRVLPPCVARSEAICAMDDGAVRVGLGYVREVRQDAAERLVAERAAGGPFRDIADLAARAELRREQIAQLVRAGACDVFGRPRRAMLWELGVLARPRAGAGGTQLALPIPATPAPPLPELGRFERTVADYETTGPVSTGWHLVTLVRPGLPPGVLTAAALRETPHGTDVLVAGLVVARQRPATAGGIVFLLLEDETGMVNCIVRPESLRAAPLGGAGRPAGDGLGAARAPRAQPQRARAPAWSASSPRARTRPGPRRRGRDGPRPRGRTRRPELRAGAALARRREGRVGDVDVGEVARRRGVRDRRWGLGRLRGRRRGARLRLRRLGRLLRPLGGSGARMGRNRIGRRRGRWQR